MAWIKGAGPGGKVLEVIVQRAGNAFRAIYTTKFASFVYVLHAFQKKSTRGIATPKRHVDLIGQRLKNAEAHFKDIQRETERKERGT